MSNTHTESNPNREKRHPVHSDNGAVGMERQPSSAPSRDDRVATVTIGAEEFIVGYRWAIYGHIDSDGTLTVFKGWKQFSEDTNGSIVALEAAAAQTLHGAPAINIPARGEPLSELQLEDQLIHVRTKNSELPSLIAPEYLAFEVEHTERGQ